MDVEKTKKNRKNKVVGNVNTQKVFVFNFNTIKKKRLYTKCKNNLSKWMSLNYSSKSTFCFSFCYMFLIFRLFLLPTESSLTMILHMMFETWVEEFDFRLILNEIKFVPLSGSYFDFSLIYLIYLIYY